MKFPNTSPMLTWTVGQETTTPESSFTLPGETRTKFFSFIWIVYDTEI